jgi:fucose permease
MFIFGVILAMPGALFGIPDFRLRLGVSLAQQGDVFLALYGGVLLSTLLSGPAIDSFGNKPVLAVCAAIAAVSFAIFGLAHSFAGAMAVAFVLGFGGGGLNTSANALVAELYDENRASMLNVVAMFFGAGALSAALLVTRIASRPLLLAAAAFVAICAVTYAALRFPPPRVTTGFSFIASLRAARLPGVMILASALFCESGNEAALGGWISTYAGPWALVAYLLPFTMSRLLASRITNAIRPVVFVIACALTSAAGCVLIVASRATAFPGAMLAGVAVAPIYPTVLALAADRYKGQAGTIFGLLFAVGLTGAVLFPFAVGHIAQHAGVQFGMVLPLVGALVIAALIYSGNRTSNDAPPLS